MNFNKQSVKDVIFLVLTRFEVVAAAYFLLTIGPLLQQVVDASLNSSSSTLYESAFGSQIIATTTFEDVILRFSNILFVLCGVAIVISKPSDYQSLCFKASICAFVTWFIHDNVFTVFGVVQPGQFWLNSFYNAIGSLLFGAALAVIIYASSLVTSQSDREAVVVRTFLASSAALSLAFASVSVSNFILNPVSVAFEAKVTEPHGYFSPYKSDPKYELAGYPWSGDGFRSPFPEDLRFDEVETIGSRVRMTFEAPSGSQIPYKVWSYWDCDPSSIQKEPSGVVLTEGEFSEFEITGDNGYLDTHFSSTDFRLAYDPGDIGRFRVHAREGKLDDGSGIRINAGGDDRVEFDFDSQLRLRLGAEAFVPTNGKEEPAERNINIRIDDSEFNFSIKDPPEAPLEKDKRCTKTGVADETGERKVTLFISLGSPDRSVDVGAASKFKAEYSSYSSFVDVEQYVADDLSSSRLGTARYVGFLGAEVTVNVDHVSETLKRTKETLYLVGKFDVSVDEVGLFVLRGYADRIWIGNDRISPTKWELLSDDWQRWILAGLLGALFAILRWILPALWREKTKPLCWDT